MTSATLKKKHVLNITKIHKVIRKIEHITNVLIYYHKVQQIYSTLSQHGKEVSSDVKMHTGTGGNLMEAEHEQQSNINTNHKLQTFYNLFKAKEVLPFGETLI